MDWWSTVSPSSTSQRTGRDRRRTGNDQQRRAAECRFSRQQHRRADVDVPAEAFGYGSIFTTTPVAWRRRCRCSTRQRLAVSFGGTPDPIHRRFAGIQSTLPFNRISDLQQRGSSVALDNVRRGRHRAGTGHRAAMGLGVGVCCGAAAVRAAHSGRVGPVAAGRLNWALRRAQARRTSVRLDVRLITSKSVLVRY